MTDRTSLPAPAAWLARSEAAKHRDEAGLAPLIDPVVAIDNGNRVRVSRRIPPGSDTP